jgi:hypothetical protein
VRFPIAPQFVYVGSSHGTRRAWSPRCWPKGFECSAVQCVWMLCAHRQALWTVYTDGRDRFTRPFTRVGPNGVLCSGPPLLALVCRTGRGDS